jgi:hypothetical protein
LARSRQRNCISRFPADTEQRCESEDAEENPNSCTAQIAAFEAF